MEIWLNPSVDRQAGAGSGALSAAEDAWRLLQRCPRHAPTPLIELSDLAEALGVDRLSYKDEAARLGLGSFKALGGVHAVLRQVMARVGEAEPFGSSRWREAAATLTFTCATDGNHGRSVAAGAWLAGARCVIFVHPGVPTARLDAIAALGAEVRVAAGHYDDAVAAADRAAREQGWILVSDTSYPGCEETPRQVMQGYGVLVLEALAQAADAGADCPFTHVFVQAGVGGLAAAVAAALGDCYGSRAPCIIVVEPARADCLFQTARAGAPSRARGDLDTAMEMLACGEPSHAAWEVLRTAADAFMTLTEEEAGEALQVLRAQPPFAGRAPTTPSGVAGLAGLMAVARRPDLAQAAGLGPSASVLVIGTEGPWA